MAWLPKTGRPLVGIKGISLVFTQALIGYARFEDRIVLTMPNVPREIPVERGADPALSDSIPKP
jgi:hypothetical protein